MITITRWRILLYIGVALAAISVFIVSIHFLLQTSWSLHVTHGLLTLDVLLALGLGVVLLDIFWDVSGGLFEQNRGDGTHIELQPRHRHNTTTPRSPKAAPPASIRRPEPTYPVEYYEGLELPDNGSWQN